MNDDQTEQLLRRYRPAGPPPGLRARALELPGGQRRVWPWAAAAAALFAATVGFHVASHSLRAHTLPSSSDGDAAFRQMLVNALGDEDRADLMMAAYEALIQSAPEWKEEPR